MSGEYRFNVVQPGPRPPYYRLAEHFWGAGCNIDSDGNSETPDDTQWTELTVELRATGERIDVDPISLRPLVLQVRSSSMKLAREAAKYLADYCGGTIAPAR